MRMTVQERLRTPWAVCVSLLVVTLLAYINSFPGAFILDDQIIVVQNPLVEHPDLITIFRSDYWHGVGNSGLFRPLTILSLGVNRALFGPSPFGFHLINVLLHTAVTLLFWRVLMAWGVPLLAAVTAALFFAIHPIHTEVVNEAIGRSELLVAIFLLGAFLAARRNGIGAGLIVCLCYLLALLSKEHAITFLAMLPLCDAYAAGSLQAWRRRWPLYAGATVITLCWLLWRAFVVIRPLPPIKPSPETVPLAYLNDSARILTALQHQWLYLRKLLLPVDLQATYSVSDLPPFIHSIFSLSGFLTILATTGLLALLVWGLRRRNPLALCGILYLVAFLPTANILFPSGVFAERFIYFPSLWFCAGLGIACVFIYERRRGIMIWSLLLVTYLFGLTGMTVWRNYDFASETRLWRTEVTRNPTDYQGWLYLAQSLAVSGALTEAESAYQSMLSLDSNDHFGLRLAVSFYLFKNSYAQALPLALKVYTLSEQNKDAAAMASDARQLANVYVGLDECATAMTYLEGPALPLREDPATIETRLKTLSCLGSDAQVLNETKLIHSGNLTYGILYQYAFSLLRLGRLTEARSQLESLVQHAEAGGDTWNLLGVVYSQLHDRSAAIAAFDQAVKLAPGIEMFQVNLQRERVEGGAHR